MANCKISFFRFYCWLTNRNIFIKNTEIRCNSFYHFDSRIFFSTLLIKGYLNNNLNTKSIQISTGTFAGAVNGLSTLGGLPCALFLLAVGIESQIIRGTLAALFFLTDAYALIIAFFFEIIDLKSVYRTIPLLLILPIGVKIGDIFFNKSKEQTYRKFALYFLIVISILGLLKVFLN